MYITGKFNQSDAQKFIAGQKEFFAVVDMTGQKYIFAHGSADGKIAGSVKMALMSGAQFVGCFGGMVAQNNVNVMPELQNCFTEILVAVVNSDTLHIIA
jgi:hypothetical protein